MRTIFILSIFAIVFTNCSTKQSKEQDKKNEIYGIIKHSDKMQKNKSHILPVVHVPITYYGNFNFILIDNTKIYYHTKHVYRDTGNDDYTKPPRVYLAPDDLKEIKINDLQNFLTSTITDSIANSDFYASIASSTDTIRNRAYLIITTFFYLKNIRRYIIRNWTEEERYATIAKIENKKYDPRLIDWKIGFDNNYNGLPIKVSE